MSYGAIQSRVDCNFVKLYEATVNGDTDEGVVYLEKFPFFKNTDHLILDKIPQYLLISLELKIDSIENNAQGPATDMFSIGFDGYSSPYNDAIVGMDLTTTLDTTKTYPIDILLSLSGRTNIELYSKKNAYTFRYRAYCEAAPLMLEVTYSNSQWEVTEQPSFYIYTQTNGIKYTLNYSTWAGFPFQTINGT